MPFYFFELECPVHDFSIDKASNMGKSSKNYKAWARNKVYFLIALYQICDF